MTKRERVLAALQHRATVPVPWQIDLGSQVAQALVEYTGDEGILERFQGHLCGSYYWGWPTAVQGRPGYFRDGFGVLWNRNGADKDIGVVENHCITDIEDWEDEYRLPPPDTARLQQDVQAALAGADGRFVTASFGFCMFERAWTLAGMENVLAAMVSCPDALERLLDAICEHHLALLDAALEYGVDGVLFGDDWGQQKGLIMGPAHWRRFIRPRMRRLYARVHAAGKYVFQHSCGDCSEIFPDLVDIGLNCYQTFQPEIYDIAEMKRLYGDKVTFWGGVSTQRCLPQCTPQQVRDTVIRTIRTLCPGGGLVIAPTHSVPGDVPPENILAMAEVLWDQQETVFSGIGDTASPSQ